MAVNVRSPRLAGSIARSRHIVFVPILLFAVRRCSIHTPIIDATDRWRRQQHAVSSQALFFISLFFRIDFPFLYNNYSEAPECVRAGGCNARAADPATMAFTVSFFCSDFGVDWMTLTAAHYIYIYILYTFFFSQIFHLRVLFGWLCRCYFDRRRAKLGNRLIEMLR